MDDLNEYLGSLTAECKTAFRDRLLYMGLQGSYLRGEANENSDIDIMVILDRFSVRDMETYRSILKKIGNFEKSCGFICGKEEMCRWNPLEVCQLLHTTRDLVGSLADYLPAASEKDEVNYVKLSLGNLYHKICHRYIHADRKQNVSGFRGTCKGLLFLLQNLRYLETGRFAVTKAELLEMSDEEDRRVLKLSDMPDGFDFDQALSTLFAWMQRAFARIDALTEQMDHVSEKELTDPGAERDLTYYAIRRKTQVLLLNGPSSAGKSSIAKVLQRRLRERQEDAVVVSLDDYLQMSGKEPIWEDDVFAVMPHMCADASAVLQAGRMLIIDHVITSPRILQALLDAVRGFQMKTVLVSCPVETLRKREAERGDRCVGSAEASLEYLYPKTGYDLCLDSGTAGPEYQAEKIMSIL